MDRMMPSLPKQDAVKRYRLSVAEGDQVEALEAIQTVEHDGSISL